VKREGSGRGKERERGENEGESKRGGEWIGGREGER
jgi:hypothetical protein